MHAQPASCSEGSPTRARPSPRRAAVNSRSASVKRFRAQTADRCVLCTHQETQVPDDEKLVGAVGAGAWRALIDKAEASDKHALASALAADPRPCLHVAC